MPAERGLRAGRAHALIDFDRAAPGRPVWDLAMTARFRVPLLDPAPAGEGGDWERTAARRLRVLADAYGLSRPERAELPRAVEDTTAAGRAFVARRVADGHPGYARLLAGQGGWERWDRLRAWPADRREAFTSALPEPCAQAATEPGAAPAAARPGAGPGGAAPTAGPAADGR
ncbi:hypothetical protein GCM10027168_43810 [Streptomyces capparidis]